MREKLATARARSNMETCAASAWGDPLGNLLLRGIDNGDGSSLRRAKFALARELARINQVNILIASRTVHDVLIYLADQRCPGCYGQQFIRQESSIRACPTCEGTGLAGMVPANWREKHFIVLRMAQSSMGRTLSRARASLGAA